MLDVLVVNGWEMPADGPFTHRTDVDDMTQLILPNESADYRAARNSLLAAGAEPRQQIESVAAQRRALPGRGDVPEDYRFVRIGENGMPETVAMPELFGRHDTLILYSYMYGPERTKPCPMGTHLLDSFKGAARHVGERAALFAMAKSPLARLVAWAHERGWSDLKVLSTAGNRYNADYFGDSSNVPDPIRTARFPDGRVHDETVFNVFRLDNGTVRHFWGSELTWAASESVQHHRSGDAANALRGLLDMTPEGRGQFLPRLAY